MLSDNWIKEGYTKTEKIPLVSLIYLKMWVDNSGEFGGACVDFEYANDIHYELNYADWLLYLQKQFAIYDASNSLQPLSDFLKEQDWRGFESSLKKHNINFSKICFY